MCLVFHSDKPDLLPITSQPRRNLCVPIFICKTYYSTLYFFLQIFFIHKLNYTMKIIRILIIKKIESIINRLNLLHNYFSISSKQKSINSSMFVFLDFFNLFPNFLILSISDIPFIGKTFGYSLFLSFPLF